MNEWHSPSRPEPTEMTADDPLPPAKRIEVNGVLLGEAVEHDLGVRFIARNTHVSAMDRSIWPTAEYARRSARQLFKSARSAAFS